MIETLIPNVGHTRVFQQKRIRTVTRLKRNRKRDAHFLLNHAAISFYESDGLKDKEMHISVQSKVKLSSGRVSRSAN